jgi:hypothetical protein
VSITYVGAELRRLVTTRAEGICEYCLINIEDTHFGCCVEHVIAEKHGGATNAENLAFACVFCNRYKGSDLGSLDPHSGVLVRFFHPRTDRWSDHFRLTEDMEITPCTDVGRVTVTVLRHNSSERLLERQELHAHGFYPGKAALRRIRN